jgi:4-amino-4-deoxy-L-arabinose transferase-like glycosyltransferase
LFSLPVGLVCSLAGARSFLECTLPVMRLVPILCSLVGLWLLVRLALAYGASERAALLAGLVYATLPVIVLTHRLVKAENLLAVFFMGAVLAVRPERRGGERRGAVVAGVLCALAIWTKATGVAVVVVAAILLLAQKRRRDAAIVCGLAAGGLVLYLGYAALYDFGIFLKVMHAQSTSKWVSAESFVDLLSGKVVVKWFGRGTYLWLWIAAACLVTRRARLLLLPIAVYGALLALNADHRVVYGWYRAPLYPFLCVAAGLFLDEWLEEPDLGRVRPAVRASGTVGPVPHPRLGLRDPGSRALPSAHRERRESRPPPRRRRSVRPPDPLYRVERGDRGGGPGDLFPHPRPSVGPTWTREWSERRRAA